MDKKLTTTPGSPIQTALNSPRVLVIEDDEFQRMAIITRLLAHKVEDVCAVENAEDALETLRRAPGNFDITLCDIRLNDMDGMAFLLRADAGRLGAIVLHSSLPNDIQQATARLLAQRGVPIAACLPKPLNMPSFLNVLRNHVAQEAKPLFSPIVESFPEIPRSALLAALRNDEFVAYFQPQIHLEDHSLYGVEALCRWNHPTLGLLQPQVFLPSVLEHGLMDELTWRVVEYSLGAMRAWPRSLPRPRVGINVSATSLRGDGFVRGWKTRVEQARFDPSEVTLELTETEVALSDDALLETLTRLRILGFGVAIDDFGAGNTSLIQLRQLPVTELKIDRAFVSRATGSGRNEVILDAVIYMANELSLCSIAEGVESAADAELLKSLGCRIGQGYYFVRPMSFEKLAYWVRGQG
ncbi:EAL domain-containing response regulator [Parapusillimonas granuli]|uniref:EAL domain-containing response regulator n=1 Tax=Parapusillimonas granuli TaxID=380911 RepID=A0A853FS73_9BURK|nr:EAL domain-containing response regulator [Parapusillimonas granuli]MBB5213860.1 EAL domain-containing protein (putative c-di-GMP-specific phosphodiesterase class I)/CheY-like chemotaxis protein [Parapusillimonas granuli]MEB2398939.1 EAL domain-containing response regulator [Alcaligenaceae bacterium]NYT48695.1 EAL domain-containing response regulator [Parapusillimonas granuli]